MAAETVLSICQDQPISPTDEVASDSSGFMFPYIQGVLAFDTPYLGISPGVVAFGAEGHLNQASAAYKAFGNVATSFGWGTKSDPGPAAAVDASRMLPPPSNATADAAATPTWQRWGRYAMFAGAAGAVAAGGAAAYMKRESLSEGWKWAGSHLEFVGCLARGPELDKRLQSIIDMENEHDFGFLNVYTALGRAVEGKSSKWSSNVLGEQRTFCSLPKNEARRKYFVKATNDAATDEIGAHTGIFTPRENPGYHIMAEAARDTISRWTQSKWYADATMDETKLGCGEDAEIVDGPGEVEELDTEFEARDDLGP